MNSHENFFIPEDNQKAEEAEVLDEQPTVPEQSYPEVNSYDPDELRRAIEEAREQE